MSLDTIIKTGRESFDPTDDKILLYFSIVK